MRFAGKNVIVTGGASGIGAATARRFANEGAHVVVADMDRTRAEETATAIGGTAVRCDVTLAEDVEQAIAAAAARGSVDVLVACAGNIRYALSGEMTEADWDSVIDTHLKGAFFAARAAQRHMVEKGSGKIVLISSTAALGVRGQINYSTAKAGLQGMTKTMAIEFGPFGINVNCVAPGPIETAISEGTAKRLGLSLQEYRASVAAVAPLGRMGRPEDVAGVIAFLCSEDAGYVSGQVIYVRGGP